MYYNQIDPIGESQDYWNEHEECAHCGAPDTSYKGYCSKACYKYDTY